MAYCIWRVITTLIKQGKIIFLLYYIDIKEDSVIKLYLLLYY